MKNRFRFLTLLLAVSLWLSAFAQMRIAYGMDTPSFILVHEDTDRSETLDSCYLTVSYEVRHRASEHDDSLSRSNIMDLQAGRLFNAFFSRDLRDLDIENTHSLKTVMQIETIPDGYLGWDILLSHSDSVMTVTNRLPFTTQVTEYTEKLPAIEWREIPEETDTVMGYPCRTAVGSFGGREWTVAYTEAIPLPYGPWKLNGEKGLILKASDADGGYLFEAVGLTQKKAPILRYDWPRKRMGKREWMEFERDMYANAGAFARNTGTRILITDNSEKGFHPLNESDDWVEYYNPLEKE